MSAINPTRGYRPSVPARPQSAKAGKAATGGPAPAAGNTMGPVQPEQTLAAWVSQSNVLSSGADRVASAIGNALIQKTYEAAGLSAGLAETTVDHFR